MISRTVALLTTFALGLCCLPLASGAQSAAKVPRIEYLSAGAAATSTVEALGLTVAPVILFQAHEVSR